MTRLYIKGCVPSPILQSAVLAPGDEVWTINNQAGRNFDKPFEKTPTRHFSLHGLKHEVEAHGEHYLKYLSDMPWPVYLWREQAKEWPKVAGFVPLPKKWRPFPLAAIMDSLSTDVGLAERRYFTGSGRRRVLGARVHYVLDRTPRGRGYPGVHGRRRAVRKQMAEDPREGLPA